MFTTQKQNMFYRRVCISPTKMLCSHDFLYSFLFWTLGCTWSPPDSALIQKKWGISLTLGLDSGGCPAQQAVSAGDILLTVWKRCCFSWREDEWMYSMCQGELKSHNNICTRWQKKVLSLMFYHTLRNTLKHFTSQVRHLHVTCAFI